MDVYSFDPLEDSRWTEFVARHPKASIFHTSGWLRALHRTYRFEPVAFTTSRPTDDLQNALVFAAVRSWLTGSRLVSLPFSDHCEPLVDSREELQALCSAVLRHRPEERWRYIEIRPTSPDFSLEAGFGKGQTFLLHRLNLRPDLDVLLSSFHKDSIRRKIRRAERERLTYEEGRSEALLRKLCYLLDLTRQRHQVPLQPRAWFDNLIDCLGGNVCIRIVSKDGQPVAGILTLAHGKSVVYKYGGSDTRLNSAGGIPFLFWKAIQDAKRTGAQELDLGRSDCDAAGLIAFKEHLAATRSTLTYWRCPEAMRSASKNAWAISVAKRVFARLPGPVRRASGRFLYPHIG
jgi:CelD/BcsL family acetyltransferase involved in cellulose biosynthesis